MMGKPVAIIHPDDPKFKELLESGEVASGADVNEQVSDLVSNPDTKWPDEEPESEEPDVDLKETDG